MSNDKTKPYEAKLDFTVRRKGKEYKVEFIPKTDYVRGLGVSITGYRVFINGLYKDDATGSEAPTQDRAEDVVNYYY